MAEKVKYNFDKSSGIFYKHYFGKITLDDIFSSWDYAFANDLIPDNTVGFILDYTQANLDFEHTLYYKIAEYYRNHLEIFRNKKIAIIIHTPKDVVVSALVETKDSGYSSHPFYTLEAAREWVLS